MLQVVFHFGLRQWSLWDNGFVWIADNRLKEFFGEECRRRNWMSGSGVGRVAWKNTVEQNRSAGYRRRCKRKFWPTPTELTCSALDPISFLTRSIFYHLQCKYLAPTLYIIGHFGDESFQAINYTDADNQTIHAKLKLTFMYWCAVKKLLTYTQVSCCCLSEEHRNCQIVEFMLLLTCHGLQMWCFVDVDVTCCFYSISWDLAKNLSELRDVKTDCESIYCLANVYFAVLYTQRIDFIHCDYHEA